MMYTFCRQTQKLVNVTAALLKSLQRNKAGVQRRISVDSSDNFMPKGPEDMTNVACVRGNNTVDNRCSEMVNGSALSVQLDDSKPTLKLQKVVIIGKMTRYEFEKLRFAGISEDKFRETVTSRGSDYNSLLAQHNNHVETMRMIENVFKERGIEYQVCTRGNTFTVEMINWADAIITAGGDGTFLSAASRVKDQFKPVIGINTNPKRSEGHLCLPPKYTKNLDKALDMLANGQFRWLWRQRIRITMTGAEDNFTPIHNGDLLQSRMVDGLSSTSRKEGLQKRHSLPEPQKVHNSPTEMHSRILCVLALNEVFIGESLAAVPSYYEIQIDDRPSELQKSSGLCVCTGTGSTAWSHNICRLPSNAVRQVLEITAKALSNNNCKDRNSDIENSPMVTESLVQRVAEAYSQSYIYEPDSEKMLFSVRDPMENRVFECSQSNGFARRVVVRSRCWDASLCIDGEVSFSFNDGAVATLEILPTDALRTVVLNEEGNV